MQKKLQRICMCGVVPTWCQRLLELPSNTRELQTTQQKNKFNSCLEGLFKLKTNKRYNKTRICHHPHVDRPKHYEKTQGTWQQILPFQISTKITQTQSQFLPCGIGSC
jgi:hypothetical protein